MTVKDLEGLFDYGYWANKRVFEAIARLTPEQFRQPVAGSHGSIRNTLVHALSAEWGWLSRCGGPARGPALQPDDFATLDSLLETWNKVEGFVRQFLRDLGDKDLSRTVEFTIPPGEPHAMALGELLQHAACHGVHHRGQVAVLLRLLGHAPGNFDLLLYYADKRAG
jgi:uncharacterized damage-inducible protein DinB